MRCESGRMRCRDCVHCFNIRYNRLVSSDENQCRLKLNGDGFVYTDHDINKHPNRDSYCIHRKQYKRMMTPNSHWVKQGDPMGV
jgi:hypothetical protein